MKKVIFATAILIMATGALCAQVLVKPAQVQGYYIVYPGQSIEGESDYVESIKAGPVVKSWKAGDVIAHMLKKTDDMGGNALVFTSGDLSKADVVTVTGDDWKVKAEQREGIFIVYPGQTLLQDYNFSEKLEIKGIVKNFKAETLISLHLKRIDKKSIACDAILLKSDDLIKGEAVEFN